jgi:hypothetical protein
MLEGEMNLPRRLAAVIIFAGAGTLSAHAQTEGELVATTMPREACTTLSVENYRACCIASNRAEILSADAVAFCELSAEEQARQITALPEVQTPRPAAAPPPAADAPAPAADVPSPAADAPADDTEHVSHSGLADGTNPGQGAANSNAGDTPGGQGIDNPGGLAGPGQWQWPGQRQWARQRQWQRPGRRQQRELKGSAKPPRAGADPLASRAKASYVGDTILMFSGIPRREASEKTQSPG